MSKRRGHGEGTITVRADGRWEARLSVGHRPDGKRKRAIYYGATRKEVAVKLADALHDHGRGLLTDPSRETTGQYLERWLADCVAPSMRATTAVSYRLILRKHAIPELGQIRLAKLEVGHVRSLFRKMLAAGLSGAYVTRLHAILRRALAQAVTDEQLTRNVLVSVRRPRKERKEMRVYTPEEVGKLIETAGQGPARGCGDPGRNDWTKTGRMSRPPLVERGPRGRSPPGDGTASVGAG
jgi:integrase